MKRCTACNEVFHDQFAFCPTDATPLTTQTTSTDQRELHLTIIDNTSLLDRLAKESRFLIHELQQAWPELQRDPLDCGRKLVRRVLLKLRESLLRPNAIAAVSTAVLVLFSAVLILVLLDKRSQKTRMAQLDPERVQMLEFPPGKTPANKDEGDGSGSQGRVGMRAGKGEGSGPKPKKSTGGGSGGDHDRVLPQIGAIPPPSEIPAPIPKFPPTHSAVLPVAGTNIDPALWQALPMPVYGDPRSQSAIPSNGPGTDGGMGTNRGTGVGDGEGTGVGPGSGGNIGGNRNDGPGCCGPGGGRGSGVEVDPDRNYSPAQVTERAHVLAKPEPQYTEDARKSGVSGSVILRVVFARTGEVTNIRAVSTLPFGLTERAIAAARQIRFRPAMRDGHPVNVSMQLEYNFNLY
ncbi:MAG TPA: energy transducer TonB [Pyrinomonadaceae bacterium]|nr:energy transducer TonB [Pyrinomonadaceae bacterium]